jgi:hypothetical protein
LNYYKNNTWTNNFLFLQKTIKASSNESKC